MFRLIVRSGPALILGLCVAFSGSQPAFAQTLSISCGAVGVELELCRAGVEAWSAKTGCPSPLKLGHYFVPDRGDFDGSETTFRRGHSEAVA